MRMDKPKTDGPIISGFSAGGFKVDEGVYSALLISPVRADGWAPPPLADLTLTDLESILVLDPPPEFIMIGTGANMVRPAPALVRAIEARGFGVEAMDSRAAARAWAVLRGEGRWIAAALYPLG